MQRPAPTDDDAIARPQVEVRRSAKRRRTVSAYREGGVTVVLIPARMSRVDERRWVEVMLKRLDTQDRRRKPSDADLLDRATDLSRQHLGGRATPVSVCWVTNQGSRWGSCTPGDGSIRLSHRLQGMPRWVSDYVLVHELAHLLVSDHSAEFWELVSRYPRSERARGYLEGYAVAAGVAPGTDSGTEADEITPPRRAGLQEMTEPGHHPLPDTGNASTVTPRRRRLSSAPGELLW